MTSAVYVPIAMTSSVHVPIAIILGTQVLDLIVVLMLLLVTFQPMDYAGFKLFMSAYLGDDISDQLCQTLFFTFHKKLPLSDVGSPELPRALLKKFLAHNSALSCDSLHIHTNGKLQSH